MRDFMTVGTSVLVSLERARHHALGLRNSARIEVPLGPPRSLMRRHVSVTPETLS
jgi:hypothetical protein